MFRRIKKTWAAFLGNRPKDCYVCKGTGEASGGLTWLVVWWKGEQVLVCYKCKGTGKLKK